jgi:hypothetical protein
MAGKKKRMTMSRAITILRESGWRVDVDKASRRIVLQNPRPDVNWLHVLRKECVTDAGPVGRPVGDNAIAPKCPVTR